MKKKSFSVLLFIFLIFAISCTVFAAVVFAVGPKEVQFSSVEFEEEYDLGYELTVPDVNVIFDGKEYSANKAIVLPDGTMKNTSKQTLSIAGRYSVVYSAIIDGFRHEKTYSFNVKEVLFGFDRTTSKAVYDENNDLIKLRIDGNNNFRYNAAIDLSDNDLSAPFFEMYNVASETGERDCETVMITLTDVDDQNNYINIRINAAPGFKQYDYAEYVSYVAVSVNGAEFQGKDGNRIHSGNAYGTPIRYSFCNLGGYKYDGMDRKFVEPENDRIQLYYLAEKKQMYVYCTAEKNYGGLVVDFKSEDFYKELWEGFSVDKCKLSLYITGMKRTATDIYITDIDGQDMSAGVVTDNVGPKLNIDVPEQIPYGMTGYEYEIFGYSVRDDYGVASSSVSAYYDYYSENPIAVSIQNGKIYPQYQGVYTLEYSAVDNYGNVSINLIDINVDDKNVVSPISVEVAENYADCLAGTRVIIKDCVITADVKYGGYTLNISAVCGSKKAEIKDGEYFYANAFGEWKVIYELTDRLGRKAFAEKTFNASANPNPVFGEEIISLPKYLLSGITYTIPDIKAYRYGEDLTEELDSEVKYVLNGVQGEITNGKITPIYEDDKENILDIIYYVGSVEYSFSRKIVQTLKDDALKAEGLFFVENGNVLSQLTDIGIEFTAEEDSVIDFVTPVLIDSFALELSMLRSGSLSIVISDEQNVSQTIVLKIVYENGLTTLYMNGVKMDSYQRAGTMLSLNKGVLRVNTSKFNVRRYNNGDKYVGFDSKKTDVSFLIDKDCKVRISQIANQPISAFNEDAINPTYYIDGNFDFYYKKGDSIFVPVVYSIDVVSGECPVQVSVRANGKYIITADGIELKDAILDKTVEFVAENYGTYYVVYKMTDIVGNEFKLTYLFGVLDDIKPEIDVNGQIASEKQVGEKITLPKATATDNIDEDMTVTIFTIGPGGIYETVNGGEVLFNKAGTWTIRFFAIDEAGNFSFKDYKVNVKGK